MDNDGYIMQLASGEAQQVLKINKFSFGGNHVCEFARSAKTRQTKKQSSRATETRLASAVIAGL
jgi:hypothetical protein